MKANVYTMRVHGPLGFWIRFFDPWFEHPGLLRLGSGFHLSGGASESSIGLAINSQYILITIERPPYKHTATHPELYSTIL